MVAESNEFADRELAMSLLRKDTLKPSWLNLTVTRSNGGRSRAICRYDALASIFRAYEAVA